jgi:hypothetical protein
VSVQRIYTQFQGGVNKQIGPVVVDGGQAEAMMFCEDSYNWEPSEIGIIKREGNSNTGTYPGEITGEFEYIDSAGNTQLIVCAGDSVYADSPIGLLFTGQTPGHAYQAVPWADGADRILLLMNGADKVLVYNGSTCAQIVVTDDTSPIWADARPSFAHPFRGSMLYGGDPTHPYRIYKAAPGTYNNFDNTQGTVDAFDVDPAGGKLTGLNTLTNDLLVIYQQYSIKRLSGSAPFGSTGGDAYQIAEVSNNFGCIAPLAIIGNDLDQYFLAADGLRQLKPIQSYGDIDPLQPTYPIQSIINELNYTPDVISKACATYDKQNKQIWLSVPANSSTTNNRIIIFDVITRGFDIRPDDDIKASYLTIFNRKVYHGDYDGNVFKTGGNSYNGSVISSTWKSKIIAHQGISVYKRYKNIILQADSDNGGDVIVQWNIYKRGQFKYKSSTQQVSPDGSLWDVANWDEALWATDSQNIFFIKNPGRGNGIQIQLSSVSGTQRPKIRQIEIIYEAFGVIRG